MTATETSTTPEAHEAPPTEAIESTLRDEPGGVVGLLGTGDHKVIGRLFIGLSLLFGIASLVAVALARLEEAGDVGLFSTADAYSLFTAGELGLVLAFAIPLFLGIAIYVVPLQVGAATIAFPRAAALSLWVWLAGTITLVVSYGIGGGVAGTDQRPTDLALLALMMIVVGLLVGSVCVATTIAALRTEGMALSLVPMFTWSMLVATGVWLLTLPVVMANLLVVYLDHTHGMVGPGQPNQQFAQIAWLVLQPQIYAVAIPVLGVLADAVPAFARERQVGRGIVYTAIGAFGALAIGAWAQPAQGGDILGEPLFIVVSFAIVVPLLALIAGVAITARNGSARLSSPLLLGVVALLVLLVGTMAGALYSVEPLDIQGVLLVGFGVPVGGIGQSNLVLAATAMGALAALVFWAPKITGGKVGEGPAMLAAALGLLGALAWGVAPVVQGFEAQASGLADAAEALGYVSVAGAVLLAAAVAVVGLSLATSAKAGPVPDDPWECGQTLEWACPSPPPRANFAEPIVVRTAEPVLDTAPDTKEES